jgi:hypothetical protein
MSEYKAKEEVERAVVVEGTPISHPSGHSTHCQPQRPVWHRLVDSLEVEKE